MKIFYGWIIVGAGIVITCLGMGTMMSLGIFLQPISAATGWSRTSISTAALLNFLYMGPASFLWGALSDRVGTRAVVLSGGALLRLGLAAARRVRNPRAWPCAAGAVAGRGPAAREFTVARALCTPQFAAISFTYFACCAAHSGPIFHMVSYAIDCGVPAMAAATVFGAAGVASLSGPGIGGVPAGPASGAAIGMALGEVTLRLLRPFIVTSPPPARFLALRI